MDRKARDNTYITRCYVRIKFMQDETGVILTQSKVMILMESSLLLEPCSCSEASVTRAPASLTVAFPDGPTKTYLLRLLRQLNLKQRIILPQF